MQSDLILEDALGNCKSLDLSDGDVSLNVSDNVDKKLKSGPVVLLEDINRSCPSNEDTELLCNESSINEMSKRKNAAHSELKAIFSERNVGWPFWNSYSDSLNDNADGHALRRRMKENIDNDVNKRPSKVKKIKRVSTNDECKSTNAIKLKAVKYNGKICLVSENNELVKFCKNCKNCRRDEDCGRCKHCKYVNNVIQNSVVRFSLDI